MTYRLDPQYPYGQPDTEACLSEVLTDQQALSWWLRESWRRGAEGARLAYREADALLQHFRRVDPKLSPATMEDLRDAVDEQLQQLDQRAEELTGVLRRNRRGSIKDY